MQRSISSGRSDDNEDSLHKRSLLHIFILREMNYFLSMLSVLSLMRVLCTLQLVHFHLHADVQQIGQYISFHHSMVLYIVAIFDCIKFLIYITSLHRMT